jgi:hypothetical protein
LLSITKKLSQYAIVASATPQYKVVISLARRILTSRGLVSEFSIPLIDIVNTKEYNLITRQTFAQISNSYLRGQL